MKIGAFKGVFYSDNLVNPFYTTTLVYRKKKEKKHL